MAEEEEITTKKANRLETVAGPTMNLHNILYQNIIGSPYFRGLYEIKTYHQVIDEIYQKVSTLEPFFKGNHASTAFCLLYKLWTLKLTIKQVQGLITHPDSPYIRGLGFLYLRYAGKPADLWDWFEPYFDDEEEFKVETGPKPRSMTMGRFLQELLTENKWLGTILPRIPVPIAREIEKKLKQRAAERNTGVGYEAEDPIAYNARSHGGRGGPGRHDSGEGRYIGSRIDDDLRYDDRGARGGYRGPDRRDYSPRRSDRSSRDGGRGVRDYSPRRSDRGSYDTGRDYRRRSRSPPRHYRREDYRSRDRYEDLKYDDDDQGPRRDRDRGEDRNR